MEPVQLIFTDPIEVPDWASVAVNPVGAAGAETLDDGVLLLPPPPPQALSINPKRTDKTNRKIVFTTLSRLYFYKHLSTGKRY